MKLPFNLVVTAAGLGSRFALQGETRPKPLIELWGRPFFWWAVQSVLSQGVPHSLTFVVLEEHIRDHGMADAIHAIYPDARIQALPAVTAGAAETAALAAAQIDNLLPVGFLDCDLAVDFSALPCLLDMLARDDCGGALCCFRSANPAYSYIIPAEDGTVQGTREKQVVSPWAIAGLYFFHDAQTFLDAYHAYVANPQYTELFMSGVYNCLCRDKQIRFAELDGHLSFGTPEEWSSAESAPSRKPQWAQYG